jgi:hypothetical protein
VEVVSAGEKASTFLPATSCRAGLKDHTNIANLGTDTIRGGIALPHLVFKSHFQSCSQPLNQSQGSEPKHPTTRRATYRNTGHIKGCSHFIASHQVSDTMIDFKIPTSFADVQDLVNKLWAGSPMAVGMVVGLAAVGLYKLVQVCRGGG